MTTLIMLSCMPEDEYANLKITDDNDILIYKNGNPSVYKMPSSNLGDSNNSNNSKLNSCESFCIVDNVDFQTVQQKENVTIEWGFIVCCGCSLGENLEIKLRQGIYSRATVASSCPSVEFEYDYQIPYVQPGSGYFLRFTDPSTSCYTDSDLFSVSSQINATGEALQNPNGGNSFLKGQFMTVTWDPSHADFSSTSEVKIEVYYNNVLKINFSPYPNYRPNTGVFSGYIPTDAQAPGVLPNGDGYKVKIISVSDNTKVDLSNASFSISN